MMFAVSDDRSGNQPAMEGIVTVKSVVSRRSVAAGSLIACWMLTGSAVSAVAQEKLTLRLDFLPYGTQAPLYLAKEKGWYADNGVDVQMDDGTGSASTVMLVDSGKYDLGFGSLASLLVARDKGIQVKSIAGVLRKGDLGVLVDADSPMKQPKDLEGKVIYFSPSSVETLFIDSWFAKNGVDKSKVQLSSIDISTKVSTYLGGKGDGMFVPIPIYTIKKNIPRLSKGILFADFGLPLPGFGVFANDNAIKTKQKALAGFVAAIQKAWAGVKDKTMVDEAVAALIKNRPQANLDPVYLHQQLEAVIPYMDTPATAGKPLLWQSPDDWSAGVKASEEAGIIKPGSKPDDYFTNQFVPGAS
jgi:NitT/TauT family transport system substrate-binding protein